MMTFPLSCSLQTYAVNFFKEVKKTGLTVSSVTHVMENFYISLWHLQKESNKDVETEFNHPAQIWLCASAVQIYNFVLRSDSFYRSGACEAGLWYRPRTTLL